MKRLLIPYLLFASSAACAYPVISIADGDTLTLLVDSRPLKIRLASVDAPEKAQEFGQRSRQSLADLCFRRDAQYHTVDVDRYGRTVATVTCDGVDVNRAQVERGLAWVYARYCRDPVLPGLEAKARKERAGLWRDDHPTPPWEFRRARRGGEVDEPAR